MLQQYEDHWPDVASADDEVLRCSACGVLWPCPLTVAYNDGITDGKIEAQYEQEERGA